MNFFNWLLIMITAAAGIVICSSKVSMAQSTIDDPYEFLQIVLNPDGTLTRNLVFPTVAAAGDDDDPSFPVLSKDVAVNQSRSTSARIFLPRQALDNNKKLPLVVYFHGGGFILLSVADDVNHYYCSNLTMQATVVVVSVEYRLAPEHRLPAAYDDVMETLHWVTTSKDEWLTKFADFCNVILMGISAGGNIAYHAGLREAAAVEYHSDHSKLMKPLNIRGLILQQPFFGGIKRTRSEMELVNDTSLPLSAADLMWNLSLPLGADRDHQYCNPATVICNAVSETVSALNKIRGFGWEVIVTGYEGDPLFDRQVEFAKLMEDGGIRVVRKFRKGGYHGIELFDPSKTTEMAMTVSRLATTTMQC